MNPLQHLAGCESAAVSTWLKVISHLACSGICADVAVTAIAENDSRNRDLHLVIDRCCRLQIFRKGEGAASAQDLRADRPLQQRSRRGPVSSRRVWFPRSE